jgi:DNA (cytosine-5)-methyltransferase 1
MLQEGVLADAFPVYLDSTKSQEFHLEGDLVSLSESFNKGQKLSPFENTGVFVEGKITTLKTKADYDDVKMVLGDILQKDAVPREYYIDEQDVAKWEYLKGAKKEVRTAKNGFSYNYSEGAMVFPDALDNASRTIITGEGGKSPSRFKHVVQTSKGLRRLTPMELERLNMFPDNHTKLKGISDTKRAFFMGNALVVGVISKIGEVLFEKINP